MNFSLFESETCPEFIKTKTKEKIRTCVNEFVNMFWKKLQLSWQIGNRFNAKI